MDSPRADKVAVVDEVRERLDAVDGAVLTEYRGLTVAELAALRRALADVGSQYKIYKNTLVRRAVSGSRHEALESLLVGPTAIAFVSGDITGVAKALRDYARTNPALVVKGGMFGDGVLTAGDLGSLADLPSRDVLLAQLAGALAAPMRQMAGLLQALPQNLAYGLSALVEQRGGEVPVADAAAAPAEPQAAAPAGAEAAAAKPEATTPAEAEAATAETAVAEGGDTAPAGGDSTEAQGADGDAEPPTATGAAGEPSN
jgi:large subunit ribosomal protein L10